MEEQRNEIPLDKQNTLRLVKLKATESQSCLTKN